MDNIKVKAFSKVNLFLNVGEKGEDGYHDIESVVVPTPIFDELSVSLREDSEINVIYEDDVYIKDDNVAKTAKLVQDRYGTPGFDIVVSKRIPQGIGLGGSAADAGRVAYAIYRLCGIKDFDVSILREIGSDVPYMFKGQARHIKGTGEVVEKIDLEPRYICLLYDDAETCTKEVYDKFDEIGGDKGNVYDFMATGKLSNALARAAMEVEPSIKANIELLNAAGFDNVAPTGSGSGVIASTFDRKEFMMKIDILANMISDYKRMVAFHYKNTMSRIILQKNSVQDAE